MPNHLQVWLQNARELTDEEWTWLDRMLSQAFPGREILLIQLRAAKVIGYCRCGCKSINLKVPDGLPEFPYPGRQYPVEMLVNHPPYFTFILHVVEGFVVELEVLRGDSKAIDGPIPLEDAEITITV